MKTRSSSLLALLLAVLLWAGWPATAAAGPATMQTPYFTHGDSWDYTIVHQVQVDNAAISYAFDLSVRVPLIEPYLPLYNELVGMELDPYPDEIVTDDNGQRYAVYHYQRLAGRESLTLTQRYAVTVYETIYPFDRASVADSYSTMELTYLAKHLSPTEQVQSEDEAIAAFARTAAAGETNPYLVARNLFAAVNQRLDYDLTPTPQDAAATLARGSGYCQGYTNLYLAALRVMGIPCRQVSGYLYSPGAQLGAAASNVVQQGVSLDQLGHTWVEYYLPSLGWVPADPTFTYTFPVNGQPRKFVNWDFFSPMAPSSSASAARRYLSFSLGDGEIAGNSTATGGRVSATLSASLLFGHRYSPFQDVKGHWAEEAVTAVLRQGLMQGMGEGSFAPETAMTRAMFVTVLGRLYEYLGQEVPAYNLTSLQFTDVEFRAYYLDYLGWAVDAGLIEGYGNGRFGPNDQITREQMAKLIHGFLDYCGYPLAAPDPAAAETTATGTAADSLTSSTAITLPQLSFSDARRVSSWAVAEVAACVEAGLLTGMPDNSFRPQGQATRAQTAAILQRMLLLIETRNAISEVGE